MANHTKYIVRGPATRESFPGDLLAGHCVRVKRDAIAYAKQRARALHYRTPVRNRRISVYMAIGDRRPTLLYQCHVERKTGRIVTEVL